jgi:16S rRNA (guanine527-N7)-methyltransferase
VTFVESRGRAATFLRGVVAELGIDATVVQSTAEEAARTPLRDAAGVVVARALATPAVALELTLPLVRPDGSAVLLVGPTARDLEEASGEAARLLGGSTPQYAALEVPGAEAQLWVMIVGKVIQTPARYPRRPGIPRRRPLGGRVTGVD